MLYSGLEASEISLSSSARRAMRPAVGSIRSAEGMRSWLPNIWRVSSMRRRLAAWRTAFFKSSQSSFCLGAKPMDGFQTAEPGVHERLVVGNPML
jgi:hypothetical protein